MSLVYTWHMDSFIESSVTSKVLGNYGILTYEFHFLYLLNAIAQVVMVVFSLSVK